MDVLSEKEMMDQTLQRNKNTSWEAKRDFWSISWSFIYRHHVFNRNIYMRFDKNQFLFHSSTLMLPDKLRRICAYNKGTTPTIIGMSTVNEHYQDLVVKKPPEGHIWAGDRLTKIQTTSWPDEMWPEIWSKMRKHFQREASRPWDTEKPQAGRCTSSERNPLHCFGWSGIWHDH